MISVAEKLQILAESARYDASCASSGSKTSRPGKTGSTVRGGLCHSWAADGRCISLLKILYSNVCVYDCVYCINRKGNDIPRATFIPRELADLTINFYRRNYIEGLFLSSAVIRGPDYTMARMLETVRLLREEHEFRGYIHLKVIPGARQELIAQAGRLADRVSVNIELPTRQSLALLAPQKKVDAILSPMQQVSTSIAGSRAERKKTRKAPVFAPAGQSTQLIVGATPENDLQVMRLSSWLYRKMRLKRVYYSAYVPVNRHNQLPAFPGPPLLREHRLYQADWLIRMYGFDIDELLDESAPELDQQVDPKVGWAFRHLDKFPIEVNTADYELLLRIPGIGIRSAARIVQLRKVKQLRWDDLAKLRVVLKRARFFISISGKYYGESPLEIAALRRKLILPAGRKLQREQQLTFLSPAHSSGAVFNTAITGEF